MTAAELKELLNLLTDPSNPVYTSILVFLFFIMVVYVTLKYVVIPQEKKYSSEKKKLELQNTRMMALFSDLDPDPIIRINTWGDIIFLNPSARNCGLNLFIGQNVNRVFQSIPLYLEDFINNNKNITIFEKANDKFYTVQIHGIGYLNIAQLYLHDITELKTQQEKLERSQSELKEFSRNLQNIIEEERQRISRELHDGVGQDLVLLKLNMQKIFLKTEDPSLLSDYKECGELLDNCIKELKSISYSLKPRVLEDMGLVPALMELTESVMRTSGIKGRIDCFNIDGRMSSSLETSLYRIVQEALTNITKYSKASEFNIQLINKGSSIKLIITDDGTGFDLNALSQKQGMGIRNMRERTEAHKGTFRISTDLNDGTIIFAEIPMEKV